MAPHQLQHQAPADRLTRPGRELQFHHPLHGVLLQAHQGQAREAVLHLLGQGAALAATGRRGDRKQAGRFGLPAQFKPMAALEAAKAQLQGVAIALLGLLKATGQQQRPQFCQHRPQGGEVHGLERRGDHGSGKTPAGRQLLLCRPIVGPSQGEG